MKTEYDLSKIKSRKNPYAVKFKKPATVRLSEDVCAIAPLESSWDSFFMGTVTATDDFMTERDSQTQTEREPLE